ncbi:MAG TPA: hypothetical protein PLP27_08980 [Crocinitomicaceae bacterium]|nr:hypothetical protein [Crocinitomicaceae bacterium]
MKKLILICSLALSSLSFGQQGTIEVGSDINFWVSSTGGSFNLAPRLGYEVVDNLSVGPSLRFINHWSNIYGIKAKSNIFGFGGFAHYRFIEWLYAGVDVEAYFTPYNYKIGAKKFRAVSPAVILSAGLSRKIGDHFRINAGLNFDVINDVNSPMRLSYIAKTAKGVRIPMFYRVTFLYVF